MADAIVPTTDTSVTESVPKPPSTEELLAQMEKRLESKFQSTKDKAVAESRRESDRKLREVETRYETLQKSLVGYDPNSGVDLNTFAELQALRSEKQSRAQLEGEQKQRDAIQKTRDNLKQGLIKHAESVGVDPKLIDWGTLDDEDIPDFASHNARVLESIGKGVKTKLSTFEERLKKLEKPEEEVINSVSDTGNLPAGGKPVFTVDQIKDRTFYEKNKKAILLAQEEGRIKE
jgi:hypothetical protein